jgi:hypothetical protein
LSGEIFEVVNEMRLIIVTALRGDKTPIDRRIEFNRLEYFLQAQNAAKKFGADANLRLELALKLPLTHPEILPQTMYGN